MSKVRSEAENESGDPLEERGRQEGARAWACIHTARGLLGVCVCVSCVGVVFVWCICMACARVRMCDVCMCGVCAPMCRWVSAYAHICMQK